MLGKLTQTLGLTKPSLMSAAKFGAGGAAAIVGSELLQSRVLVQNGVPMVPTNWAPAVSAAVGIVGGALALKFLKSKELASGIVAGGVGIAIANVVHRFTSPAADLTAKSADAAEASGAPAQQTSGFGFGRAFARGLGGMAGLGRVVPDAMLFGVGTPDTSAARMLAGATVAIEEQGPMAGATVQFEDSGNMASSFH